MNKLLITGLASEYLVRAALTVSLSKPIISFYDDNDECIAQCSLSKQIDLSSIDFKKADLIARNMKLFTFRQDLELHDFSTVLVSENGDSVRYQRKQNGYFLPDYFTRLKQKKEVDYAAWSRSINSVLNLSNKIVNTTVGTTIDSGENLYEANGKATQTQAKPADIQITLDNIPTRGIYLKGSEPVEIYDNPYLFAIEALLVLKDISASLGYKKMVRKTDAAIEHLIITLKGDGAIVSKINDTYTVDLKFYQPRDISFYTKASLLITLSSDPIKMVIKDIFGLSVYDYWTPLQYKDKYDRFVSNTIEKIFNEKVSDDIKRAFLLHLLVIYYAQELCTIDIKIFALLTEGGNIQDFFGRVAMNLPLLINNNNGYRSFKVFDNVSHAQLDSNVTNFVLEPCLYKSKDGVINRGLIPLIFTTNKPDIKITDSIGLMIGYDAGIVSATEFSTRNDIVNKILNKTANSDSLGISTALISPTGRNNDAFLYSIDALQSYISIYKYGILNEEIEFNKKDSLLLNVYSVQEKHEIQKWVNVNKINTPNTPVDNFSPHYEYNPDYEEQIDQLGEDPLLLLFNRVVKGPEAPIQEEKEGNTLVYKDGKFYYPRGYNLGPGPEPVNYKHVVPMDRVFDLR